MASTTGRSRFAPRAPRSASSALPVGRSRAIRRVDDQQRGVDVGDRAQRLVDHEAVQRRRARRARRGCRRRRSGRARAVADAGDAVARGLRLGRDDGQLLADDAVEQRRLADVGAAQNCDGAGDGAGDFGLSRASDGHRRGFYIAQVSCYPESMRLPWIRACWPSAWVSSRRPRPRGAARRADAGARRPTAALDLRDGDGAARARGAQDAARCAAGRPCCAR